VRYSPANLHSLSQCLGDFKLDHECLLGTSSAFRSRMFKKLFEKGKCLLGFHAGEWNYEQPAQCGQVRVCTRCSTREQRTQHVLGEWRFDRVGHCEQTRSCARCAQTEQRVQHEWAAPYYKEEGSCEEMRACARCGEEQATGPRHQWARWEYTAPDKCAQRQICQRCGARSVQTRISHRWGEWEQSAQYGGAVRVCRQCGEMEVPVRESLPTAAKEMPAAVPRLDSDPEKARSATPARTLDVRAVGHWRHTNAMSSGGFSMVTDTHCILAEDGRFSRYSRSVSGMGENWTPAIEGTWEAADGVLCFRSAERGVEEHVYQLDGNHLFLPQEGHYRLWERV